jgi:hypothetical protein
MEAYRNIVAAKYKKVKGKAAPVHTLKNIGGVEV